MEQCLIEIAEALQLSPKQYNDDCLHNPDLMRERFKELRQTIEERPNEH